MKRLIPAAIAVCAMAAMPMSQAFADGRARGATSHRAATPAPAAVAPITPAPVQTPAPAAAAPPAAPAAAPAPAAAVERAGPVQPASVSLANGAVQFTTPSGYQFYSADDARAYLQRAGAAEPQGQILGMVGPTGQQPTARDFWGAVISYQDSGYVPASRADGLTATDFESQVRTARAAAQRPFEAFALQPAYDPTTNSLAWGERTAADGPGVRNLRHEIRVLGRSGVAGVTVVARNDQLGQVVSAAPALQSMLSFPTGQRYADRAVGDRTAALDLPGLISGVAAEPAAVAEAASADAPPAAKAGLFSGGLGSILPWIAGGVVLLAGVGWFVAGRNRRDHDDFDDDEDDGDGDVAPEEPRPAADPAPAPQA